MSSKTNKIIGAIVAIAVVLSLAVFIYVNLPKQTDTSKDDDFTHNPSRPTLALVYNDEQQNFTLGQLERLEPYTAKGGYRTQMGSIKGWGNYTGVNITTLIKNLQPVPYHYSLVVTDETGNNMSYNFSTISGYVNIYDPVNASNPNPIGKGNLTMVLAYQFEGSYLDVTKDGTLKIVFLDENGSITESSLWWKMVAQIRVITE